MSPVPESSNRSETCDALGFSLHSVVLQSEDFKMGLLKPIRNQNHVGYMFQ